MTTDRSPFRESYFGPKTKLIHMPSSISVGDTFVEFLTALVEKKADPRDIVITSPLTGVMRLSRQIPHLNGGIDFFYTGPKTSDGYVPYTYIYVDPDRKSAKIEVIFDAEEARLALEKSTQAAERAAREMPAQKEREEKLELIERQLREEVQSKKINFAFRISDGQLLGDTLIFNQTIPEKESYTFPPDAEKNPEKTVFYSLTAGILRYHSTEPEFNKKQSIYNYINPDNPAIKLSILLDRKKQGNERITATVIPKN